VELQQDVAVRITFISDMTPSRPVHVYRGFGGMNCFQLYCRKNYLRTEDRDIIFLRNFSKNLPDYMASHSWKLWSSQSRKWEAQVTQCVPIFTSYKHYVWCITVVSPSGCEISNSFQGTDVFSRFVCPLFCVRIGQSTNGIIPNI
jgi:hypothetical protein